MANCEYECSDVFDERRFYSESIAILRALLASTATSDYEYFTLCDVQQDDEVIVFIRRIEVQCDGEIVITNYELDGETPYTPTGDVNLCSCIGTLDCSYFTGV